MATVLVQEHVEGCKGKSELLTLVHVLCIPTLQF